jgi:hypothetical protein
MTKTKEGQFEILEKGDARYPSTDILAPVAGPYEIMMEAVRNKSGKDTLETLKGMIEYQRKCDAEDEASAARRAYFKAKSEFKANAPKVLKDTDNKQYSSKYASEDALLNTINPALSQFNLEASYDFPKVEEGMAVTCILTHELGHSESVTLPGPLDTSGSKNPLQQVKSTVTYLRKATFEAITGIASGSADDDGNLSEPIEYINADQVTEINDLIKETKSNLKIFLKVAHAESVETIVDKDYRNLLNQLETKKKKIAEAALALIREKQSKKPEERYPGKEEE